MQKYKQLFLGIIIGAVLFGGISGLAENRSIEAFFNNINVTLNGETLYTDTEPLQYAGRTYVPIRFIAETFGLEVKWNETTNTVELSQNASIPEPTPAIKERDVSEPNTSRTPTPIPTPTLNPILTPTPTPTLAPTPTPKIEVKDTDKQEITVYITKTGSKYHKSGCRYLSQSRIPINLESAKKLYSPCSICNPPQ